MRHSGVEQQALSVEAWYALYTRHQHERVVVAALAGKGVETFLPFYTVRRRWTDRVKVISLPLFPCYVFLRAGLGRWNHVVATPGLVSIVKFAGRPAPIPTAEIEALRRAEANFRLEPHPFLQCGDRVRVVSGPLEGIEGLLVRKKNQHRLVLSVELLGKAASLEVDVATVERVAPGRAPSVTAGRALYWPEVRSTHIGTTADAPFQL